MGSNNGGTAPEVIGEQAALLDAATGFSGIRDDINAQRVLICNTSKALHEAYRGAAGDAFYRAYLTTLDMMSEVTKRYTNAATAANETADAFGTSDDTAKDNVQVDASSAGGKSGG